MEDFMEYREEQEEKIEIHFLNLTDSQIKKILKAQLNEYKNDFVLLGVRKHPNTPMHHYLQLKR